MKKAPSLLLALALLITLLAGCRPAEAPPDSPPAQPPSGPTTQGGGAATQPAPPPAGKTEPLRDTVRIALGGEILCLDPLFSNITQDTMPGKLIYDCLVEDDESGNIIPCLSKEWTVSEDGMQYTFTLEEGVEFHDGTVLTAEDVVWSFARAIDSSYLQANMGRYCDHAEKIDEHTVMLQMKQPYAAILACLVKVFVVESRNHFEVTCGGSEDVYRMNPMGTGGYQFVGYETGVGLTLKSFPNYWRGEPAIQNMTMRVIADINAVQTSLETDMIDFAGVSSTISYNAIPAYRANPELEVYMGDGTMVWYLPINCTLPGYSDIRVRQAMTHALDKEYVMQVQVEGYGTIANTINDPNSFGFYDQPQFPYDLDKARALLAEAGYPDGAGLDHLKATIRQDRQKGTEVFQQSMKEIGITVDINVMENTTYLNTVREGGFGVSLIASTMPSDVAIFDQFWMEEAIGADNFSRMADPDLQRLLPQAATSTDPAERLRLYQEAYEIANNLCAYIPVFSPNNVCVYKKGLYIGRQYSDAPYLRFEEMEWRS